MHRRSAPAPTLRLEGGGKGRGAAKTVAARKKPVVEMSVAAGKRADGDNGGAPPLIDVVRDARISNRFLVGLFDIQPADARTVERHRDTLRAFHDRFTGILRDYFKRFPATRRALHEFRHGGGDVEKLVALHLGYFENLMTPGPRRNPVREAERIGELHFRHRIAPVWMMGAYYLYLDALRSDGAVRRAIPAADRRALLAAVAKFLRRDMSLTLEGYWVAANRSLVSEHDEVRKLQEQISAILANIPQYLWSVDVIGNRLLYVSPAGSKLCSQDRAVPLPCLDATVEAHKDLVRAAWQQALEGRRVEIETQTLLHGELRWVRQVFCPYSDPDGRVVRVDGVVEDTTEKKELVQRLHTLATTDALTGLPNRTLFRDRVAQALALASRDHEKQAAVMMLDLNEFKEINDRYGHDTGDAVLVETARRLRAQVRDADTVARLGGDEFALLLPGVLDARHAAGIVAEKIHGCFTEPFPYRENQFFLGVSIGIALCPEHGTEFDTIMKHADLAMYEAKRTDLKYRIFDAIPTEAAGEDARLAGHLRRAIERNELELHFQPKVDLGQRRVEGLEALVRWRHPELGLLPPGRFLGIAERTGLVRPMTDWVLGAATGCWRDLRREGVALRIAINIPARDFYDPRFVERVRGVMAGSGYPGEYLEMELPENAVTGNPEQVARTLGSLHDLGINITIDNYGTGASSLAHLQRLPVSRLKIGKTLVTGMKNDPGNLNVVSSIIAVAHNLKYRAAAVGVEDAETLELLHGLRCDEIQGFFIARPLAAGDIVSWLRTSCWTAVSPAAR
jgi:diguanylate cyclase (GGDEF)-like protein/PAS domain S-box-containing protein